MSRPSRRLRTSIRRRPLRSAVFALLLLSLASIVVFGIVLERRVTSKWKGRKWNVPSKIYSDVHLLYPGRAWSNADFEARLERLGYLRRKEAVAAPGDYVRGRRSWLVYLHAFQHPDGERPAFPIRVDVERGKVRRITHARTGEELASAALEPETVGIVFDRHLEDRTPVALDAVPRSVIAALLSIEDTRFYHHPGIDPIRIAGALVVNLTGRGFQGASTITQQLVKNYYLTADRTLRRKVVEAAMALILEARYSKQEILSAYLNEIYFGQRGASSIMGVEEAARHFFGRSVGELELHEAALLVGLIRDPGGYNPFRHPERAIERRNLVLTLMREQGRIDGDALEQAKARPLAVRSEGRRFNHAPHFIDFVLRELADRYPRQLLEREGLRVFTTLDLGTQYAADQALADGLDRLEKGYPRLRKRAGELEGAIVVVEPQTGFLRAMIGGRDYGTSQFNRADQAVRQPGSTFKPFVFLTAFLTPERYSPATIIDDLPFEIESGGEMWSPDNYDDMYHGPVTLRTALTQSLNIATSRLALDIGLNRVARTARDAGIGSRMRALPSLALGAFEVTPLEMASAYATLANGGIRSRPLSILAVIDENGRVTEREDVAMQRVLPEDAVYMVNHALQDVFDTGTGRSARRLGYRGRAAGKTGTTSSYRDAWFVGYTPEVTALVWVGYDDNRSIGLAGDRAALPIWVDFMARSSYGDRSPEFPAPRNIVLAEVDPETGELATFDCPVVVLEPFVRGTEPLRTCHLHGPGANDGWWIF